MLLGQHIGLFSSFETSWQFLRGAFSLGKRNDIRQGLAASCDNSHWLVNPRRKTRFTWENTRSLEGWARHAFSLKKNTDSGSSHVERKTHFAWENTRGSRGVGTARVFIPKHTGRGGRSSAAKKIHNQNEGRAHFTRENTMISSGRRERHVNLQSKWSPGAFVRKRNDFSGVGRRDM